MKAEQIQDRGNPTGHGDPNDWAKYVVDQGWENYTDENHETWAILYERQNEIIQGRACDEYFQGVKDLNLEVGQIPKFDDINQKLKPLTGWEVVAVEGLIPDLPFYKLLADRKFPSGNFIREKSQIDYIEEPDIFHDVFGHVPLLSNPVFADYVQAFGEGGLKAHKHNMIANLSRLYWYTVEFGLINTPDGLRICGAGILSSPGETVFALESDSPNRIGFDLRRIMQTDYRVDDYQQTYFVVESFEQLFNETYADFTPIYEDLAKSQEKYDLTTILPSDNVITKGTQEYAKARDAQKS